MIQPSHITDRMTRSSENRAGRDFRGGCASGRKTNQAVSQAGGEGIAMRREGHLFPDTDIQKPRTYQIEPE
jgi:hypothetical protein